MQLTSTQDTDDTVACDVLEQRTHRAHWHVPPRLLWRHVIRVKFEGAAAGRDVHLVCRDVPGPDSGVQLPSDKEGDDDRTCEVGLEECLRVWLSTDRVKGCVEGCNHAKNVEEEAIPATHDTEDSFVRELRLDMTLSLPRRSESDVGQADTSPNEEV